MSLKSIVSKLIRGEKVSRIHGHELVIREENKILDNLAFVEGDKVIIEIGSQREAGSTLYFSNLAFNNSMSFVTVDLNPETTAAAKKIVKSKSSLFEAVNDYGEKYLDKFKGRIALLYLDAFDIDGDWHSNDLRAWYKNKGSELNDENCWRMHLDCAVAVVNKIVPGGYIVFDDVNPVDENNKLVFEPVTSNYALWSGKGKTAIPYLLKNGFEIVSNQRSAALLRKLSE